MPPTQVIEFEQSWLPVRVTFLRDGAVLETQLIEEPGVMQVPPYGPDAVCLVEFADGMVAASRGTPQS